MMPSTGETFAELGGHLFAGLFILVLIVAGVAFTAACAGLFIRIVAFAAGF